MGVKSVNGDSATTTISVPVLVRRVRRVTSLISVVRAQASSGSAANSQGRRPRRTRSRKWPPCAVWVKFPGGHVAERRCNQVWDGRASRPGTSDGVVEEAKPDWRIGAELRLLLLTSRCKCCHMFRVSGGVLTRCS